MREVAQLVSEKAHLEATVNELMPLLEAGGERTEHQAELENFVNDAWLRWSKKPVPYNAFGHGA